jgi:hypothetical protein
VKAKPNRSTHFDKFKAVSEILPRRVSSNRLNKENTLGGLMPTNQGVIEQNTFFNKIGHVVKPGWRLLGYAKAPYARGENQFCLVFEKLVKSDAESSNALENLEAGIYWNHALPGTLFYVEGGSK